MRQLSASGTSARILRGLRPCPAQPAQTSAGTQDDGGGERPVVGVTVEGGGSNFWVHLGAQQQTSHEERVSRFQW